MFNLVIRPLQVGGSWVSDVQSQSPVQIKSKCLARGFPKSALEFTYKSPIDNPSRLGYQATPLYDRGCSFHIVNCCLIKTASFLLQT